MLVVTASSSRLGPEDADAETCQMLHFEPDLVDMEQTEDLAAAERGRLITETQVMAMAALLREVAAMKLPGATA